LTNYCTVAAKIYQTKTQVFIKFHTCSRRQR